MLRILTASAGSGKTFTLVKEYLVLALPNPLLFKSIVAITFTKAAAAEMRERILVALRKLRNNQPHDNIKSMVDALLSAGLSQTDINNAGLLLAAIENNYSDFNVTTIDSFLSRIVRAFAKELGLPAGFAITEDETDAKEAIVNRFLAEVYKNEDTKLFLTEYIIELINDQKSWNFRKSLTEDAKLLFSSTDFHQDKSLDTFRSTIINLKAEKKKIENIIANIRAKLIEIQVTNDHFSDEEYTRGSNILIKLIDLLENNNLDTDKYPAAIKSSDIVGEKIHKKASSFEFKNFIDNQLVPVLSLTIAEIEEIKNSYYAVISVLHKIYHTAILYSLNDILIKYRLENNSIFISDFTKVLTKYLEHESVAYIFTKLGNRFNHFLVDEFQDTSSLQWQILRPMIDECVSRGNKCLIVGDPKQSIYRWRNGDVNLIQNQVPNIDFKGRSIKDVLDRNYRSSDEIVHFNNQLFDNIIAQYKNLPKSNPIIEGCYAFQKQISKGMKEGISPEIIEVRGKNKEEYNPEQSIRIIGKINKCVQEGFKLSDIAILVRNNNDATDIISALIDENIPFISQSNLFVESDLAVKFLLSTFECIKDGDNPLALFELKFFLKSLKLAHSDEIENTLSTLKYKNVYQIALEMINIFNLAISDNLFLQKFMDCILEFSNAQNDYSISGFLDFFKTEKYVVSPDKNQEAIRIMTIHKSKGLQFGVVIIPSVKWSFDNNINPAMLWVDTNHTPFQPNEQYLVRSDKKLSLSYFSKFYDEEKDNSVLDNLNLIYVAFTRAVRRLYIFTEEDYASRKISDRPMKASQLLAMGR